MQLEGKVAIVTGGSRGIGFAAAKMLSDNGATVVITGKDKERLEKSLQSKNKPLTIAGILEIAKENGANLFPVSFRDILAKLAEKEENPKLRPYARKNHFFFFIRH